MPHLISTAATSTPGSLDAGDLVKPVPMTRAQRLWARYHPVVWWVLIVKALFGLSFTLLVPTYRGPDEANHVDMVKWYGSTTGYPDPTEHTPWSEAVIESRHLVSSGGSPRPPQRTEDAVPRPDRVPFAELAEPGARRSEGGNQMSQHPPLFYESATAAGSTLADLLPEDVWSWDREVYLYRLLSWLALLPLPLLAAEAALAVGLARPHTGIAASFTLLIPMTTFIGSVVNNDGLAVAFAGLAIVGALHYLRRGGVRWAAVAAVGCAGAPLAKSTAAPLAAWVAVVFLVATIRRSGWRPSRTAARDLAIVGVGTLIGFSWHITNLVVFGDPQPNGFNHRSVIGHDPSIVEYIPIWLSRVSSSFWGQPARRTGVTLAPWMIAALTVAAVVLCAYAVVRGRAHRWATAPLALLIVGQVALMFRTNWTAHARIGRLPALQGRYLFGLVVPLAVLVTIAFARHLRTRPPARTVAVAAAVAGVGVGLHAFLGWSMLTGGYWAADGGGIAGQLRAVVAWSPLPMVLTLGTFLATGVATVLAGGSVGRSLFGRRGPQTAPAGAAEAGGLR